MLNRLSYSNGIKIRRRHTPTIIVNLHLFQKVAGLCSKADTASGDTRGLGDNTVLNLDEVGYKEPPEEGDSWLDTEGEVSDAYHLFFSLTNN